MYYCQYRVFPFTSGGCIWFRGLVISHLGEDWVFLTLLGITMAVISFVMDYVIEKFQEGNF